MIKHMIAVSLFFFAPLAAETNVLALAGSIRESSYNKYLAKEASEIARKMGATVKFVDLKEYNLPFYDEDFEAKSGMPQKMKDLRRDMVKSDVIIIASPEYNASLTGVLKNMLDWASRTENGEGSNEAFKGKKFAIMSASPGRGGGKRGLVHLQTILQALGGEVASLQVTVPEAHNAFNSRGQLNDSATKIQLENEIKLVVTPR